LDSSAPLRLFNKQSATNKRGFTSRQRLRKFSIDGTVRYYPNRLSIAFVGAGFGAFLIPVGINGHAGVQKVLRFATCWLEMWVFAEPNTVGKYQ
jgi:hypothetical protein